MTNFNFLIFFHFFFFFFFFSIEHGMNEVNVWPIIFKGSLERGEERLFIKPPSLSHLVIADFGCFACDLIKSLPITSHGTALFANWFSECLMHQGEGMRRPHRAPCIIIDPWRTMLNACPHSFEFLMNIVFKNEWKGWVRCGGVQGLGCSRPTLSCSYLFRIWPYKVCWHSR